MERLLNEPGFTIVTAGDGVQALEKIEEWTIDLILTDLQMPKMDGLELVRKVRKSYPTIPIILTTGQGSEEIAAEALQAGATSYIPKTKLSGMLSSTVKEVLDILNTERSYEELIAHSVGSRFQFELSTNPTLLPQMVDFCLRMLQSLTLLDRIDRLRIVIAVDQALHNALYRGNLEFGSHHRIDSRDFAVSEIVEERVNSEDFADRKIGVLFEIKPSRFGIRIQDDGPGFDTSSVGSWGDPSLRGIILMNAFMDSVVYNDKGNVVEMRFNFNKSEAESGRVGGTPVSIAKLTCRSTGQSVVLSKPKIVIGSRTGCHIKLKSQEVAALHCTLNLHNDEWMLVVLTKKGVTLLNDKAVQSSKLTSGDVIKIGDREFEFEV
jgi:CheY-like chemotaxis protein